jgi:hypothetical protein
MVAVSSEPQMAMGRSRLGFLASLAAGGDGVEADEGEDDGRRGGDPVDAVGGERRQVPASKTFRPTTMRRSARPPSRTP